MAMRYANETDVLAQLHLDPDVPGDEAALERVRRLELGVCERIDVKLGRSFGVPVAETRTVRAPGVSDTLILPQPLQSVSAVTVDGAVLDPSLYRLVYHAHDGYLALRIDAYAAVWSGDVTVTGIWADAAIDGDIPDDIREAATFVTVDEYRAGNASPAGEIGPDGQILQVRNPWRYELVRTAIEHYALRRPRVGV